jgi:MFS family permease
MYLSGEKLGRKKTLMIGVGIMSIGAILQTSAFSVQQMIVARLITGVFIDCFTSCLWRFELELDSRDWERVSTAVKQSLYYSMTRPCIGSINTATAPIWQSETSKPTWRGKLVVFGMMYVTAKEDILNTKPFDALV